MRIQEELRAIDEEAMYHAPATTYRAINEAAALLDEAERVVEELLSWPSIRAAVADSALEAALRAFLARVREGK